MNPTEKVPRTATELSRLPDPELLALATADVDIVKDRVAYQESVEAAILAERRGLIPSVAQRAEEQRRERTAGRSRQRSRERLDRAAEQDVVLPRWWFTSGRWAKLDSSGTRVAPALAALVRQPGQHVTVAEVAEFSGTSRKTAARGIDACHAAGIVRKHTKTLSAGNLVRKAIFVTIPDAQ